MLKSVHIKKKCLFKKTKTKWEVFMPGFEKITYDCIKSIYTYLLNLTFLYHFFPFWHNYLSVFYKKDSKDILEITYFLISCNIYQLKYVIFVIFISIAMIGIFIVKWKYFGIIIYGAYLNKQEMFLDKNHVIFIQKCFYASTYIDKEIYNVHCLIAH